MATVCSSVPWRGLTRPVLPLCEWKSPLPRGFEGCLPRDLYCVSGDGGGLEQVTHTTHIQYSIFNILLARI